MIIDSHCHLYLDQFDQDRKSVIERAQHEGIIQMLLPNIDSSSMNPMLELVELFPDLFKPMIGLHPGSVRENYKEELEKIFNFFRKNKFVAIGEIGIDLYWPENKNFIDQQVDAFDYQIGIAEKNDLPVVIHIRNSFEQVFDVLRKRNRESYNGVFHCFSGNSQQAKSAVEMGFYLGIGGVVTFKNSGLTEALKDIPLERIILETDAPFLAPVPFRGSRNEPSYLKLIAEFLAGIYNVSLSELMDITLNNTRSIFAL